MNDRLRTAKRRHVTHEPGRPFPDRMACKHCYSLPTRWLRTTNDLAQLRTSRAAGWPSAAALCYAASPNVQHLMSAFDPEATLESAFVMTSFADRLTIQV